MSRFRLRPIMRGLRGALIGAILAIWASAGEAPLAQCAMCGSAAESGDVGRGLNISILFMLGTVLTLASGLIVLVVRAGRQDAGRSAPPDPDPPRP